MITVENLTKYYGKNVAVNNISFTINDNEILGFLGPNGAGKSTTMNMIAGFLPMTKGKVTIYGEDIALSPTKAKKLLGYLPEIPPVYPDMKVKEYLNFCAGLKKIPKLERQEQIKLAMEKLAITDVSHRLIKNLSKGYRQRVGFAQAILGNPKFLILDEPTVGLDPEQVIEVRQIIRDLKKDHSVIFSSHILSEVSAVCDRVIIINKGEIRAIDTIEQLEKKSNSSLTICLKLSGDTKMAKEIISATKGIDGIAESIENPDGSMLIKAKIAEDNNEIRNALVSSLVTKNIQILEVYTEKPNLEDVFVKLVNQPVKRVTLKDMVMEEESKLDSSNENKENI